MIMTSKLNRKCLLTPDLIAGLPAVECQRFDSEVRGFIVQQRKAADGSMLKSYWLRYRFGGKDRKIKIGDVSELSVDQARKIAAKHRMQILAGVDPQAVKKAAAKPVYAEAVEQYLAMKATKVRPGTLRTMRLYLKGTGYFACFNRRAIDSVTGPDIQSRLDDIVREVSAASAKQARANLNSFFMWAARRPFGLAENPVLKTEPPEVEEERHRALSADELKRVWLACDDSDYGKIVKLLILTGCRREEIGCARWSWIDLDAGTITLPPEVTDGRGAFKGTKNECEHMLPLPAMALDIIKSISCRGEFVFGSTGFKGWDRSKKALLKVISDKAKETQTGAMKPWRLHDLRHTVSTLMNDIGVDPHIVDATLNHLENRKKIERRYNHSDYLVQKRDAMARWSAHIESIVTGKPAKVEPIRKVA
jgi:integrase